MNPFLAALIFETWAAKFDPEPNIGRGTMAQVIAQRERPHIFAPMVPETFRGPKWGTR